MLKRITTCLFTLLTVAAMAQNRATITGKVVDSLSTEPLEFATVAVVNQHDSALVSYTVTLKTGAYSLHNLPAGQPLRLLISFVGYQSYHKPLLLEKNATLDLGTIKLSSKGHTLNEVKITADISPIIVKKDTIEFNAEAFKTPPNAVVEELLRRLPGIQVDMDGTISVNGKKVNKLLIDGKQFFVNDPRIASKNLDASLIAKVQIYDDREDDPDHLIPDSKVDKIINLKLKSAIKKSSFGKINAGAGSRDRFDTGMLYSTFRDTLQVSLIGLSNNLNSTGFSYGDFNNLAGFSRGGDGLGWGGIQPSSYGNGIQTATSAGLNVNTDYGKKLKINLLYYYAHTSYENYFKSLRQQFLSDTTITSNGLNDYHTTSDKHNISSSVEWNPDTTVTVRYKPRLNFSNATNNNEGTSKSFTNLVPKLNDSYYKSDQGTTGLQFQQNFSYHKKLHRKGSSFNIDHSLNINPGTGLNYNISDYVSYTNQLTSSNLHRLEDNLNNYSEGTVGATYRYTFNKKFSGSLLLSGKYGYSKGRTFTYNQDLQTGAYTIYIDSLSRNLVRNHYTENIEPQLIYQATKTARYTFGMSIQFMQVYNRFNKNVPDINRFNTFWLPSLNFSNEHFSFGYSTSVRQPSIDELLPYAIFFSQLYSSSGNPDLQPVRSHNFNVGYYKNVSASQFNLNLNGSVSLDENSIFYERRVNGQGATLSRPVNKNGAYSGYINASIGKGFKKIGKWQIRLNSRVSSNYRHNFFQVNNNQGFQNSLYLYINNQFFINWNNKVELNPSYNVNPSITKYENVAYNTINYVKQTVDVPLIAKWIKHYTIELKYSYNYNPLATAGFRRSTNILNFAIGRQIQARDRGEIKLSCYDLLDQNVSAYRYAGENSVSDQQSLILKRYFLLSYSYRFNSTVTKKK